MYENESLVYTYIRRSTPHFVLAMRRNPHNFVPTPITLLYAFAHARVAESRRFLSARRARNRIRKNSANVSGYRADRAEVRGKGTRVNSRTWQPKGGSGISWNTIW